MNRPVLATTTSAATAIATPSADCLHGRAAALADRTGRSVRWQVVGESGATAQRVQTALVPQLPAEPADLVVLGFGVNDIIRRTRPAAFAHPLRSLIGAARLPAVAHVPLRFDGPADDFMADDGFHASSHGYATWGAQVADRAAGLF